MSTPPLFRMRLLQPVRLAGHQRQPGDMVELGIDSARHLLHQRRAVPADEAGRSRLLHFPIVTGH